MSLKPDRGTSQRPVPLLNLWHCSPGPGPPEHHPEEQLAEGGTEDGRGLEFEKRAQAAPAHSSSAITTDRRSGASPSTGGRENKRCVHGQWTIVPTLQGRVFWHTLQHAWVLRTLCSVKLASHKRTNSVPFPDARCPEWSESWEQRADWRLKAVRGWRGWRTGRWGLSVPWVRGFGSAR